MSVPVWDGAVPLAGKRVLLHAEQGYGDTLQFCRYAPLLASQGAHVILEIPGSLIPLLRSLAGIEQVKSQDLPPLLVDTHCALPSLPCVMKTEEQSIPYPGGYLTADPAKVKEWSKRLGRRRRVRVGVAWSGKASHSNDANRSMSFEVLDSLWDEHADFICLQKEIRATDAAAVARCPSMHVYATQLTDFAETAALVSLLDLVICVDTAVAHLAGALGIEVWLMLPKVPDWRWMTARQDSPWYSTARLFRQSERSDWASVVLQVGQELRLRCHKNKIKKVRRRPA
jgi:hypothetical protein